VVLPIELIKACKKHTKANSPKTPGFLSKNTSRTLQSFGLSLLILFRGWLRGVYETSSGSVEVSEAALEVARVAAQVATTTEMQEPPPGEWLFVRWLLFKFVLKPMATQQLKQSH